jgi:hypothetical protein
LQVKETTEFYSDIGRRAGFSLPHVLQFCACVG